VRSIEIRDLYYFKYRVHGINYLKFYKDLKKLGLDFLIQHKHEFFYLSRYVEYGPDYLSFLNDVIELNLNDIVDMKDFREHRNSCILKWVFMNIDGNGRSENN